MTLAGAKRNAPFSYYSAESVRRTHNIVQVEQRGVKIVVFVSLSWFRANGCDYCFNSRYCSHALVLCGLSLACLVQPCHSKGSVGGVRSGASKYTRFRPIRPNCTTHQNARNHPLFLSLGPTNSTCSLKTENAPIILWSRASRALQIPRTCQCCAGL